MNAINGFQFAVAFQGELQGELSVYGGETSGWTLSTSSEEPQELDSAKWLGNTGVVSAVDLTGESPITKTYYVLGVVVLGTSPPSSGE
eukprot:2682942-Ditylum_brightwellii.AAC.1